MWLCSSPTVVSCMFFVKTTTMYSLGYGLHILTGTVVPRLTQSSTLRGMVKWVSAFRLSNSNKWRGDGGCGFWQPTDRLTARVVCSGLRVGGRLAPFHIHYMNRVNSCSGFELWWQHHKHCHSYYYYYYYSYYLYMEMLCACIQTLMTGTNNLSPFLPVRRYASAGLCDSDVSVRPSVCLSVRLSVTRRYCA